MAVAAAASAVVTGSAGAEGWIGGALLVTVGEAMVDNCVWVVQVGAGRCGPGSEGCIDGLWKM